MKKYEREFNVMGLLGNTITVRDYWDSDAKTFVDRVSRFIDSNPDHPDTYYKNIYSYEELAIYAFKRAVKEITGLNNINLKGWVVELTALIAQRTFNSWCAETKMVIDEKTRNYDEIIRIEHQEGWIFYPTKMIINVLRGILDTRQLPVCHEVLFVYLKEHGMDEDAELFGVYKEVEDGEE